MSSKDSTQLVYLIILAGIAIIALAVAVVLAAYGVEGAGKVVAIAAGAVGGLIAIGPSLMNRRNGNGDQK